MSKKTNDIKKQSTLIKNKDGFHAACEYLSSELRDLSLTFDEVLVLLKKYLSYYEKIEPDVNNILQLIKDQLIRFDKEKLSSRDIFEIGSVYYLYDFEEYVRLLNESIDQYIQKDHKDPALKFDVRLVFNSLYYSFLENNDRLNAFTVLRKFLKCEQLINLHILNRQESDENNLKYDATWFKYSGGICEDSRAFCKERANKFFCINEIKMWGRMQKSDGFELPNPRGWKGMYSGTNDKTIFYYAGGRNCGHSIMAVSIFGVPKEDVLRAVSLGYYKPDEFEIEELGL